MKVRLGLFSASILCVSAGASMAIDDPTPPTRPNSDVICEITDASPYKSVDIDLSNWSNGHAIVTIDAGGNVDLFTANVLGKKADKPNFLLLWPTKLNDELIGSTSGDWTEAGHLRVSGLGVFAYGLELGKVNGKISLTLTTARFLNGTSVEKGVCTHIKGSDIKDSDF